MYKIITILIAVVITGNIYSQEPIKPSFRFGGPISTLSYNTHGATLAFGGWGTFIEKKDFTIGIFGQVGTSIISKKSELLSYEDYDLKNRFTGFWFGYNQSFKNYSRFYISYYTKVGFGQVYLDNPTINSTIYDRSILISPAIEPVLQITPFMQIGLGVFYDFMTGVELLSYSSKDFNAIGLNLSIRFVVGD